MQGLLAFQQFSSQPFGESTLVLDRLFGDGGGPETLVGLILRNAPDLHGLFVGGKLRLARQRVAFTPGGIEDRILLQVQRGLEVAFFPADEPVTGGGAGYEDHRASKQIVR